MKPFQWHMPTRVVQRPGSLDTLHEWCESLGTRPLLVTGRTSARQSGALGRALAQLPGAVVFDAVEENPSTKTCEAGAAACLEQGCDVAVGIGGGSAMDVAKAIAVLARNPGPCEQYFGVDEFPNDNLPVVAVPTTAGTGSEVTPYAVITNRADDSKRTITGRTLFPRVALLDAELSVTMPKRVTANTGLDALSQAMEGVVSVKSTPAGDALAFEACRVIREWLPRAVAKPEDLEARNQMLFAAMLSGCVIAQSGTTLVHGMGYPLTLECGLPHGLANAVLLIPLFQFNAHHQPDKVAALAAALGYPAEPAAHDARQKITEALRAVLDAVGVSPAGSAAGVQQGRLREFAELVCGDTSRFKNQVGLLTVEDVHRLYVQAHAGST